MTATFILAQVCGFCILVCTAVGIQMKNKDKIVFFQLLASIFSIAQYLLLWALTGAAIAFVNAGRCFVFYLYARKDKRPHLAVFLLFEALAIVAGVLTWQSWWSILPIIISMTFTYGLWQTNTFIIKLISAITSCAWIVYNVAMRAYIGVIQQAVQVTSSVIAMIRLKLETRKNKGLKENSLDDTEIAQSTKENIEVKENTNETELNSNIQLKDNENPDE